MEIKYLRYSVQNEIVTYAKHYQKTQNKFRSWVWRRNVSNLLKIKSRNIYTNMLRVRVNGLDTIGYNLRASCALFRT